jgi:hypothetical protein
MTTDDPWITGLIDEKRKLHTSITGAVSVLLQELLKGHLSERQLTQGEMGNVAKVLIGYMVPAPPKVEAKQ